MKAQLWSLSGLATELDIDRRTLERQLKDLEADEVEVKGQRTYSKYFMSRVVDHLMGGKGLDYTAERARLAKEQADAKEMENEVRRGELLEEHDVVMVVGGLVQLTTTRLLAMPAQLSPYLANKDVSDVESQLNDAIYEALTEISTAPEEAIIAASEELKASQSSVH